MLFDPENPVNQLCIAGMDREGSGDQEAAAALFRKAWDQASTYPEKFTAAHYVARHQNTATDKLTWDLLALELAFKVDHPQIKATYPSLFLNIAKDYEDLENFEEAIKNYRSALLYAEMLPDDGYGTMIKAGIQNGLNRLTQQ